MYGSQLWILTSQKVDRMCVQWRKAHRQVLSVPKQTHCDLLPLISNSMPLNCLLESKFLTFFKSLTTSENSIVRYMAISRLSDHSSTFGSNVKNLLYKCGLSADNILSSSKSIIKTHMYNKWL